ncbi:histidine kinase [Chryseomicrobium excrementi]|uniref:Histidine kinase n=2 Tax=Chryseomicrobium excrementi TaxID=2041346 RepID=A0A2M9EYL6_9BACL|nr:histidine kinase [Chryseomicrobium excrementi]
MEFMAQASMRAQFKNFDEAAETILHMMAKLLNINTLFIAKNDRVSNEIYKVVNGDQQLLEEGTILPFEQTYCSVSVQHGNHVLYIPDITTHEQTKNLQVTHNLKSGSFVGIPIYTGDGKNYGTICGLDTNYFELSEEHMELFETMSALLSYVLELDDAQRQIQNLSVPIVPLTERIAILPVIGNMTRRRVEQLVEVALVRSQELNLDYLFVDLSGITEMDQSAADSLMKITNLLNLLGVKPVLTGLRPETVLQTNQLGIELKHVMIEANLERALSKIGFSLQKD